MKLPKLRKSSSPATPKPRSKSKHPKIASAWKLFRLSWRDYRTGVKAYVKILAIVTIPFNLLALLPGLTDASGNSLNPLDSFAPFAAIIMNVALIWAIIQRERSGKIPTVAEAYYDGSSVLVRYLLVSVALVLMLIPAAFASILYGIGVLGATAIGATLVEELLVTFVALLLAAPSIYLLVRHAFAPYAIVREGMRPLAALRYSRALTAGRFWPLAQRFVLMVIFLTLMSLPATLVTVGLSILGLQTASIAFFEVASTLLILPLANIFFINTYRELQDTAAGSEASAA